MLLILRLLPAVPPCRLVEELVQTAHNDRINDLAFPFGFSDVFATCGIGYIRVWHLSTCRELLRISVPNLEARCVTFSTVGFSTQRALA